MKAIIIEDEKAAVRNLTSLLGEVCPQIEIVTELDSIADTIEWFTDHSMPDLVFMDIHMPYMNGFEIIQKMKDTKVIIITAYDSFEYAQKALRLGASDILSKPIDMEQLKQAVIRAIGWSFTGNEVVDTILAYLYGHYAEKIELETLAQLTYCTESHIARVFKKHTGTTIISYVHKIRIEKSIQMMEEQNLSVKEAALAAGYQNLNHFYKYFTQYTGMTPAAYIKQRRP